MPNIALKKVHSAIDRVTKKLEKQAARGQVTAASIAKAGLSKQERAFADAFFRLSDNRSGTADGKVSVKQLNETASYTKKTLIDRLDVNRDGLSTEERSRLSKTAALAVALVAPGAAPALVEPKLLDLSEMTPAAAQKRLALRLPAAELEAMLSDAEDAVANRDGRLIGKLRFSEVERIAVGSEQITVTGTFKADGTEYSFYAVFEAKGANYTMVDSGAD